METQTKQSILVPIDFTNATEYALDNAISFSEFVDCDIYLLHVLDELHYTYLAQEALVVKSNYEDYKRGIDKKMQDIIRSKNRNNLVPVIKQGNIFDVIPKVGKEVNACIIFLGTHGRNSFWKALASDTLKLVDSTNIPVIITQENNFDRGYRNILYPIIAGNDPRNKAKHTLRIAENFNSNIHFFIKNANVKNINSLLEYQTQQVKDYFHKHNKNVISVSSNTDKQATYEDELLKYAESANIDLILLISDPDKHGMIFGDDFLESIFFNKHKIPVMCVNSIEYTKKSFWSWEHFHAF